MLPRLLVLALRVVLLLLPSLLLAQWLPLGPDGGDARSLAHNPHRTGQIFLGTSHGQIFVSNDGGRSWSRFAHLGGDDYVIDHIYVDPNDTNTLYAAAWSIVSDGGDVFRSRDAGRSWKALPGVHGKSVRAMAMAASDSRLLTIGALDGVFRSRDGGDTWQRISPANHAEIKNIESIAVDPRNPDVVYAGTWHLAWKTNDGGGNWHPIKRGVIDDSDVFSIIVDHHDSNIVYLSACSGIYRSESAGELFHKIQGIPFSARRTRVLQQDPSNPSVVYAGTTEGLWQTQDAGKTWKRITQPNIIVNDILVDPHRPSHVLLATDRSGVLVSNDVAAGFTASNRGFAHRQVSAMVVDRNDPQTLYVGLVNDKEFGGVFLSQDGGSNWTQMSEGLNGRDVFTLRQSASGTLVAGTNQGIFARSARGSAWRPINTVLREKSVPLPRKSKKEKARFRIERSRSEMQSRVAQLELTKSKWFAATSGGLYMSTDEGASWRGGPVLGETTFRAVSTLGETVLLATSNRVLISRDGGNTWSFARLPSFVTTIYRVAVAPGALWLATWEGAWRSNDSGATWEHVLGGLPTRHVAFIDYDQHGNHLLATDLSGNLYASADSGQSWQSSSPGFSVRSVTVAHGRLIGATTFDGVVAQPSAEIPTAELARPAGGARSGN